MRQPSPLPTSSTGPSRFACVAICTYDRVVDVRRCLAALMPQASPAGLPVIVVDSGTPQPAADELRAVTVAAGASYHRIDVPGVSMARNEALRLADSEWVLSLDDDAEVHDGWVDGILSAIREAPSDVAIVGGRILPAYPEGAQTAHVDDEWRLLLSCVDHARDGDVAEGNDICGANMAMRSDAVRMIGGFPHHLGRVGTRLISCEEAFVIERLADEGLRSLYDRRFAVDHHVPSARLEVKWARDRIFWQGASWIRMTRSLGRPLPSYLNPLKLALSIPLLWVVGTMRGWPTSVDFRLARATGQLRERMGLNA